MAEFTTLPGGSRERRLLKPLPANERQIEVVRLQPPKYRDIMRLGDPTALVVMSGAVLPQNDMSVVAQYVDLLITDERGQAVPPAALDQADYRDALAMKDAVLDFFKPASASTSTDTPTP